MIENQTNVKKPNIVEGKGGENGQRIETWRTSGMQDILGDGGTRKERTTQAEGLGTAKKHAPTHKKRREGKKAKQRNRNIHRTHRRPSLASLSLLFVFLMEPSRR